MQIGRKQQRPGVLIDQSRHAERDPQQAVRPFAERVGEGGGGTQQGDDALDDDLLVEVGLDRFVERVQDLRAEIGTLDRDEIDTQLSADDRACVGVEFEHDGRASDAAGTDADFVQKAHSLQFLHETGNRRFVQPGEFCDRGARKLRVLEETLHDQREINFADK